MEEIVLLVVPVLITIFVYALIKSWMDGRAKAQSDKVQLLEEALKNPAIDRATIEKLAFQLTGAKPPNKGASSALMAVVLAVGWITLFAGGGVWVFGEMTHEHDAVAGGVVAAIIGFGLVTYPFALRELEARRAES